MTIVAVRERERGVIALRVVLGLACLVTVLVATLLGAAIRNDNAIKSATGVATADVMSVRWDRTVVEFRSADGQLRRSPYGVLYPSGLVEGQKVQIEYALNDPELVRVAGRSVVVTLIPLATTVFVTWLVAGPVLWWLRRRRRSA